ncbi:uncharacterized protein LOC122077967 [Macadamia integrifolia]|uniref:uncharacterized protein LOC122077967 n=1 Tax=Macadamia integrifolia TaxID=60698 RepID=UPI001C4EF78C|nr:uncharacterized protein LOC122077967 [Macadamia integrifolia]
MMPLNYEDWRYVPEHYKEQLWNHIQYKYEIPIQCQKHVRQQISGIWRAFKKELKKETIKKYGCLENSQPDDRVPADQWRDLVAIWTSAKKKAISEKNKDNRKLQVMNHSSGRMSYARVGEKLSKEHPTGKWPGRVKVFLTTHKKKGTNQPTDERSGIVMAKMKQKQSELPPELRDNSDEEDNIYREACGEEGHGRVRGIGLGVSPKDMELTKTDLAVKRKLKDAKDMLTLEFEKKMEAQLAERERKWQEEMKAQQESTQAEMKAQQESTQAMMAMLNTMKSEMDRLTQASIKGNSQSSAQLGED